MSQQMKESGIEWIGEIPINWKIGKIGQLYSERREKVSDTDFAPLSVTMQGIVPQLSTAAKTDAHDDRKLVRKGDFAINSRSDRRGSCGVSPSDGSVSLINTILCPHDDMNADYYNWLFHTSMFADEFYKWGHGIVNDLWTTGWQEMKRISIPVPPLVEQEKIARFLDLQCGHIDAVIEKTKDSIEDYKKLNQAIITKAVTNGIRDDRPMKDSGIAWLDKIPVEWSITRLKAEFDFGKGLPITKDNLEEKGIPVISYGQIHAKYNTKVSLNDKLYRFVNASYLQTNGSSLVKQGDIIVADTSEDLDGCGNCAYVDKDMTLFAGYHTIILKSKYSKNNKYLAYLMLTDCWRSQLRCKAAGVKLFTISKKMLSETSFIVPSEDEQEEIVTFLDEKRSEVEKIIDKKTKIIEELERYKKSLVFQYVTGKKEVI